MKLLEKLRAQPAWQSDDPSVRLDAVRSLPDDAEADAVLLDVARADTDARVRRAAVDRITDLTGLIALATDAQIDADTRGAALEGVRDVVLDAGDPSGVGDALAVLTDERDLGAVARSAASDAVALVALERVVTDKTLGGVARKARHVAVALEAVRRLMAATELASVATKADDKATALAAFERLTTDFAADRAVLEDIARHARQKSVARRAREACDESAEVGQTSVPAGDADATALCDRVERLATSIDSIEEGRRHLDEAVEAWSSLDGSVDPEVTARFTTARRAVEDRLLALDAASAEAQRVVDERHAAESSRSGLCARVEQLPATESPDTVRSIKEEWSSFGAPVDSDPEAAAVLATLAARFEAAVAAWEARRTRYLASRQRLEALDPLVARLEQLVAGGTVDDVRKTWPALDEEWRKAQAELADLRDDEALRALRKRHRAANERRKAIEAAARGARDEVAKANLDRLQKLVANVDNAIRSETLKLGEAERRLREARQTLDAMPPLPTRRDRDALTRSLREGTTALLGRVRELRDFADWQRWANLGIQEELCRRMEALATPPEGTAPPSDADLAKTFRDLMTRWREVADAPREKGQALWKRFKAAHDVVYPRCQAFFETQKAEREQNRARRVALVEEAERLQGSTDWIKTASRLTSLQAEWKQLGPAPRKDQRELWERFRTACSAFFTRRKADLAGRKKQWADNLKAKEELCAKADALADAEDVPAAIEEIKRLQTEWKKVGPVRRNKSDAIWTRFRAACDGVFDRVREGERQAAAERIAAREAVCVELESLTGEDDDLATRVREVQRRWRQAPEVPPDARRKLSARFGQCVARLVETHPDAFRGTDLDPARKLKQLERLCERAEALVPAETLDEAGASPAEILAKKWREQLAANTMGAQADDVAKRRAALDEVKRLQAEHRRLGPVSGENAGSLNVRFQRACDRAYQKNQAKATA